MAGPGGGQRYGLQMLSASLPGCTTAMAGVVDNCVYGGNLFFATNTDGTSGGASDFCSFMCPGCTFRVNLADGLPVELLGFGVD